MILDWMNVSIDHEPFEKVETTYVPVVSEETNIDLVRVDVLIESTHVADNNTDDLVDTTTSAGKSTANELEVEPIEMFTNCRIRT